ncbi:MAG: penicillin-binding protein 2 [Gemmatimonadetes bacterium]|nr:penicillin-binding protein 2 [Gemmatimonadota bacterium]
MQLFHLHARRRRARGAILALFLGLGWLCASLFQTQVLKNMAYALQSDANRLRPFAVPAPRGTVYDRYGRIIADNLPGYSLALLPAPRDSLRNALARLAPVLGLPPVRIEALLEQQRKFPAQPLVVSPDLSFEQISAVEERRRQLPGVFVDMRPKRNYAAGQAVAHLVGYVAEISEQELKLPAFQEYVPGQTVGKAGLERQYERILGGKPGVRYLEVDAYGHIIGELAPQPSVAPVPGKDLRVSLDLELQRWIDRIFPDSTRGAMVALEPGTGEVLALYSSPAYDPNQFVGGVSPDLWRQLNADSARPLLHRALTGLYPPGSAFKLASAAIALELGVVDPKAYMPIPCRGGMQYGNRYFKCWYKEGHGYLTLPDAIKNSCNVFFYQLGLRIGLERFLAEANRLGFSRGTGIDLPVEATGHFPDGVDWFRRRFGWKPTPTEVLSLAIGQGPNSQSPLRMALFYAALAGGGRVPAPRLARGVAPVGEALDLKLSPENLEWLKEGLRRVVSPGGTAYLSSLEHWELIGKTGTSQNPHGPDHGWFMGIAGPKGGSPEIVIAAVMEFSEHGSSTAQYVSKAADFYLRRKHGIPVDTIQTLRDHLIAGKPAPWATWR